MTLPESSNRSGVSRRKLLRALAGGSAAAVLAGCQGPTDGGDGGGQTGADSGGGGSDGESGGSRLRLAQAKSPVEFDPVVLNDVPSLEVAMMIFDPLYAYNEDGTELGAVSVRVADTLGERYTGLSDTESLGPDEGMLFVHGSEGEHAYVMRDMAFPIDIVFVGADREITAIHHAETEEPPLTRYSGTGKWVLEVPYEWTTEHGVEVGDRIRIEGPNATAG